MNGNGPITVGNETVYALYQVNGPAAVIRVSGDDCDRLDFFRGKQIRFGLPGREPGCAHLMSVVPEPPFVWVEMALGGKWPSRSAEN